MKKRYLPFGYAVRDGNIVVDTEQRTIVQNIFTAYLAGNTFQQIAKSMISKGIEYHQNDAEWNKNTISRILGNETYCGTDRYPPIVTKEIFRQAAQVRSAKASAYSAALAPFRKDIRGTSSVCQGIGVLCSTCAISQGYTMWLLRRKAVLAWKNKSVALPTVQNVERTDRRSGVIRRNHSKVKMATGE